MRVRVVWRKQPRASAQTRKRSNRGGILWAALSLIICGGLAFAIVYYTLASKPRFGLVTIRSEPSDAEVFVDNQKIGRTPVQNKQLPAGKRRVRLAKEGYFDIEREITVRSGTETPPLRETLEPIIHVQLSPEDVRKIDEYIRKAQMTLTEKIHLPPPEDYNTYYFCAQILKLDPSNQFARKTVRALARELREQAGKAYANGDLVEAEKLLADLAMLEPADMETAGRLDEVRQQVQQKREERETRIAQLTQRLEESFAADRLAPPQANNAVDLLRELAQVDPRNRYARGARMKLRDLLRARADRQLAQQDWPAAKNTLAAALQISPGDAELGDKLVAVNKKLDEVAQAELEKQRRAEQERQRVLRGQELRRSGLAAYRAGNYERALEDLRGAGDIQGFDEEIAFYLGLTYLEMKQPERALTAFRDCIAANPGNVLAHVQLGILYLNHRKDFTRAEDHLQRALQRGGAPGYDRNRLQQMIRDVRYQALLAKAGNTPIPVEHNHAFGACRGELLLGTKGIEYRVREGDHGFSRPFSAVRSVTYRSDGIELRFDDKKYSFRFRNREDIQIVRDLLSRKP